MKTFEKNFLSYPKDFQNWYLKKKEIHENNKIPYFYEREIWWCAIGLNVGFEQDGKNFNFERPIVVLKKFNEYILWAIPLTSKQKVGKYYYAFNFRNTSNIAILSQLRLISSKRLLRKIGTIPERDFLEIKNIIKNLL